MISIAAPADESVALNRLATQWTEQGPTVDGRCVGATVVSKDSSQVAAALGAGWDTPRDGPRPHVWIPESSLWLSVAASRSDAADVVPRKPPSIASSPVVLAVRRSVAEALGWPKRNLNWTDVIGAFNQPALWVKAGHREWTSLRVGVTDPAGSTAGLASVLTILDQAATGVVGDEQLVDGLSFTQVLGAIAPDPKIFFAAQSAGTAAGDSAVAAFPALERDIVTYEAGNPAVPMIPIYDAQHPVVADYPYATLSGSWVSQTDRLAAEQFLHFLLSPTAQRALAASGLRAPDRSVLRPDLLPTTQGFQADVAPPRDTPAPDVLSRIISDWANLQRRVNLLAALDTSGSMNEPVPGTNMTRLGLLQQTSATGFSLLPNTMSIGLWEFSSRPGVNGDYRELVPFGPIFGKAGAIPRRQALAEAIPRMRASGATPLYNTVYAAFHHMQQFWLPNSTNAVLLITDGANELDGGLTLAALIDKLKREQRPDRPVQVVGIAVGPQADAAALQQISAATGGRSFVVKDSASAIQTLILAFTGRLQ